MLRTGKKPATEDRHDLLFANYVTKVAALPKPPTSFGHYDKFPTAGWGMLGNDDWGDCAWAGPDHETMLLTAVGGKPAQFTAANTLSDYSAGTGFDPNAGPPGSNPTDQGSDMREVAKYRQKRGLLDWHGRRHKIGAYVWLEPGNTTQLFQAMYLFGCVGIGIEFPGSAMDQFNAGKNWSVVRGASIEGGHYIAGVGRKTSPKLVTWGKCISMTAGFYQKYNDETCAYVSTEALVSGKSPEGFDMATLAADLKALVG